MAKITKTVQLQLLPTDDWILETLRHAQEAMNYISQYAHEHRLFQAFQLHHVIYHEIRERFHLRSQMAANCLRAVAAQYKGQHKPNRNRKLPVTFTHLFLPINYPRDYRLLAAHMVSINTIIGRQKVAYRCGTYQHDLLQSGEWTIASAVLCQRHRDHKFFLNIAIEREQDDHRVVERNGFVGIDVGLLNLAVTVDSENITRFYKERHIQYVRYKYQQLRQSCQAKGTRAARRKLRALSGREKRFVADTNHRIAKKIITNALATFTKPILVLEDLTGIRKNPRRSKKGRYRLNTWAFYQLQQFIAYKAGERGIPVLWIDPAYTSQQCPKCGHIERKNRNKHLHRFCCQACGYRSNDDRVGALNIRNRGVVPRQILRTRGICQVPSCSTR